MTLEDDFQYERWNLVFLVDWRKSLSDESEAAIKIDLEIIAARELIRAYETLKGYWSQEAKLPGMASHGPRSQIAQSARQYRAVN